MVSLLRLRAVCRDRTLTYSGAPVRNRWSTLTEQLDKWAAVRKAPKCTLPALMFRIGHMVGHLLVV